MKQINKKAQQSRNDLAIWYVTALILVIVLVGGLYGLGIVGQSSTGSLSEVTTAAVAVQKEPPFNQTTEDINNSYLNQSPNS